MSLALRILIFIVTHITRFRRATGSEPYAKSCRVDRHGKRLAHEGCTRRKIQLKWLFQSGVVQGGWLDVRATTNKTGT